MSLNYEGQTINSMKWNGQEILGSSGGGWSIEGNPFSVEWCYPASELKLIPYPGYNGNQINNYSNILPISFSSTDRVALIKTNMFQFVYGTMYFFYLPDKASIKSDQVSYTWYKYDWYSTSDECSWPYKLAKASGEDIEAPFQGNFGTAEADYTDRYLLRGNTRNTAGRFGTQYNPQVGISADSKIIYTLRWQYGAYKSKKAVMASGSSPFGLGYGTYNFSSGSTYFCDCADFPLGWFAESSTAGNKIIEPFGGYYFFKEDYDNKDVEGSESKYKMWIDLVDELFA